MFEFIHKHKRLAAVVIAVASISFIFWLFTVQDIKQMFGMKRCVVAVEDKCVSIREFRYNLVLSGNFDINEPERKRILIDQVLTAVVQREILFSRAKDAGVYVSSAEVLDFITKNPSFQENGRFSPRKYTDFIERLGLTAEEYEEILRKDMVARRFFKTIFSVNYFTDEERDFIERIVNTKFDGEAYLIKKSEIIKDIKISEKEILDYYKKNQERFKTEEKYVIRIWRLDRKEKALKLYNDLKNGLHEGANNYEEIELSKSELLNNETFNKVSMNNRVYITKDRGNYNIYYLHSIIPPKVRPLAEVRPEIEKVLKEEKADSVFQKILINIKRDLVSNKKVNIKKISFINSGIDEFVKLFNVNNSDIIDLIFSDTKVFGPFKTGNDYIIVRINNRKSKDENRSNGFLRELFIRSKAESLLSAYIEKVFRESDIDINREYLDKLQ